MPKKVENWEAGDGTTFPSMAEAKDYERVEDLKQTLMAVGVSMEEVEDIATALDKDFVVTERKKKKVVVKKKATAEE